MPGSRPFPKRVARKQAYDTFLEICLRQIGIQPNTPPPLFPVFFFPLFFPLVRAFLLTGFIPVAVVLFLGKGGPLQSELPNQPRSTPKRCCSWKTTLVALLVKLRLFVGQGIV